MQEPWWKRWTSYLFEWHIESTSSEYNPHLYVSLNRGRYQLCTANAIYSFGDLYDNFSRAFSKMDLDHLPGDQVLILGFGLGSIPLMLEKNFDRQYHYTAIEIDEAILELTAKYTLPDITSPVETICTDASAYVVQSTERFAMICMDVFLDDKVPSSFESEDFLHHLSDLLLPDGMLLFNRLAATPDDIQLTKSYFENTFRKVFPDASYLDVRGNWMLFNRKI
ncbi:MAG: hypothetical protein DHS20C18_49620 [Saprospiraceae bacterium]|nr:MAG: hypothetical protein DHS20C18_49620 [Saprospiraceae bacterium]